MNFGGPEFVLALVAMSTGGWLISSWIRARHGYPLQDEWSGKTVRAPDEAVTALRAENTELRGQLGAFSDRVRVLERIVTDKGYDVATQIEALRDDRTNRAVLEDKVTS